MMKAKSKLPRWMPFLIGAFLLPSPALWAQTSSDEHVEEEDVEARGHRVYRYLAEPLGRGYLGVQLLNLTPELRIHFGISEDAGVMVAKVEPGSPAEQAGVQVGDILTEIDGESIESPMMLSRYIRGKEEGDSVSLGLWREGGAQAVFATIAERERSAVWLGGSDSGEHGVRVVEKGPFVWDGQDFRIGDEDFTATLGEAMEGLEEHFNSEEWQVRLEHIQSMDWEGMRQRMEELESRLKELEQELNQEGSNQGEGSN
jgi:hypothetical protein